MQVVVLNIIYDNAIITLSIHIIPSGVIGAINIISINEEIWHMYVFVHFEEFQSQLLCMCACVCTSACMYIMLI